MAVASTFIHNNLEVMNRNTATKVNPTNLLVNMHITDHGSDWLWAAFSVFLLLTIIHLLLFLYGNFRKPGVKNSLLVIPLFTNAVFSVFYFTYASNLGYAWQAVEFQHAGTGLRQIFYAKFVAWFVGWPAVLALFEIVTSTVLDRIEENPNIFKKFFLIFQTWLVKFIFVEIYVLGLLIGSIIFSTYKFGYFTFAVFFQLLLMVWVGRDLHRSFKSPSHSNIANFFLIFFYLVWILYPVAWGLSEGGNVIQPDSEAVFYGILDLITFGLMPTILIFFTIKGCDEEFFSKLWQYHVKSEAESIHENEKAVAETPSTEAGVVDAEVDNEPQAQV